MTDAQTDNAAGDDPRRFAFAQGRLQRLVDLRVVVIGAGIGGLAAALALARQGAQVTVLEQAEAVREVGAGIQVSPNGMRVIEALGLDAALTAASIRGRAVALWDGHRGEEVLRMDLRALPDSQSYHFVHRGDVIALLDQAARDAGVQVRLLHKAAEVRPGAPAQVHLRDGQRLEAELVVGADGVHSVARAACAETAPARFTGQVAWRTLVPNTTGHPAHARVHMGARRHLVSYPLRDGSLVNIVAVQERRDWAEEGWHHPGDPAELRSVFADFDAEVHRLLAQVRHVNLWGLFRHPVARQWWAPGLALLGDAAHPTLPFLAQGANMALEDAFALVRCLEREPDMDAALARYQTLRHARAERVIKAATGNAWKYHLPRGPVRALAHAGLRGMNRFAPNAALRGFDWLYGYDITKEA